jgi:pyruvate dehydrogenase E2 component (dihydrolipoamide acetyltransferase)
MAKAILMPKQGITVETCFLGEWHVKIGDTVSTGSILFDYETDKAVFECPSEVEGTVLAVLREQGDIVTVLTPVAVIGAPGEDISAFLTVKPVVKKTAEIEASSKESVSSAAIPQTVGVYQARGETHASPRAKKLAEKQNIDLRTVLPTGPKGRILEMDVRNASVSESIAPAPSPDLPYTVEELTNIRKIIGKAMSESLTSMAQLTHTLSYDATDVLKYHSWLKKEIDLSGLPKITLNDIVIYAVSRVLHGFRELNGHLINGTTMHYFKQVNMGVATDTPRGLMVPTLFGADQKTLVEIANASKDIITKAVSGKIDPDLLKNGSFTISNLGTLDIEHFTPIINPPQTGILGVNTILARVRFDASGNPEFYRAMGLSLTYDHRAIDGAGASRFLKELKEYLQEFSVRIGREPIGLR